jgi:Regulator of chromosome condensation (RCC1) repeat
MQYLGDITKDIIKDFCVKYLSIQKSCLNMFLYDIFPKDILTFLFKLYYNLMNIELFADDGRRLNISIGYNIYDFKLTKQQYYGRPDVYKIHKYDKKIQYYYSNGINSFIITNQGELFGIGENEYGQLGLGNYKNVNEFKKINIPNVKSISFCSNFTYIQTKDDYLHTCGSNIFDLLINKSLEKIEKSCIIENTNIKVVSHSCGIVHSLILTKDNLYGFGDNVNYQLGSFTKHYYGRYCYINNLFDINKIISFQCGTRYSFILTIDGLYSTGCNDKGQLGHAGYVSVENFTLIKNLNNILSFNLLKGNSFVLTKDGLYGCGSAFTFLTIKYSTFTKIDINNVISYTCTINDIFILNNKGLYRTFNKYDESSTNTNKQKDYLIPIKF